MIGAQLRAARALISWSQSDLSEESDVSLATIKRMEAASGSLPGRHESVMKVVGALERGGVVFIGSDEVFGPGIRLKKPVCLSDSK
jgi:transcriptional regulator with XRE-family HTH domain